jgi:DtxR family Mn-dependent transcriptional regulator
METKESSVSVEAEEYLEAIYRLEEKMGLAKTMDLVRLLKVAPGSVTNTIEGLERRGLVLHEPYKGVKLTEKGRKLALKVLKRHRLAERLLTDVLHLDWSKVHDMACRLEHAITKDMVKPLEKALGYPKTCPHGNPIPARGGAIEEKSEPLANLNPKESGVIIKITEEEPSILQQLSTLGLIPGVSVEVEQKARLGGPVTVRVGEASYTLDHRIVSVINVRRMDESERRSLMESRLTDLRDGESGIITSIKVGQETGRGERRRARRDWGFRKRLEDMGLTPGTKVTVVKSAPFNGPLEVYVRGSRLALGRGMADRIFVEVKR